ncbi:MAG: DNA-processing protein DprA [Spirochaeta sp.]|nr:DNA-processing protein DprA [Spirochaeta sp.]
MERFADAANRRETLLDAIDRGAPRPDLDALLMVGRFPGFRALDRLAMLLRYPRLEDLCAATPTDVEMTIGRLLRKSQWEPDRLLRAVEVERKWMTAGPDRRVLWIGDSAYPPQLRRVYDMPAILYVRGTVPEGEPLLIAPTIAVVGTRRPDQDGLVAAYTLGRELAGNGVSVVSGLARGIDAAAHRGVVAERAGAPPVVVLGSGVDTIYPSEHRDLAVDILNAGGVIVSEYPPGRAPSKYQFPARNRIIVGLSHATVLVQAPERSGALISAELAQDIGHDVMVHAAGSGWTGGAALLDSGATLVQGAAEILAAHPDLLRTSTANSRRCRSKHPGMGTGDTHKDILAAFGPVEEPKSLSEWWGFLRGEGTEDDDGAAREEATFSGVAGSANDTDEIQEERAE